MKIILLNMHKNGKLLKPGSYKIYKKYKVNYDDIIAYHQKIIDNDNSKDTIKRSQKNIDGCIKRSKEEYLSYVGSVQGINNTDFCIQYDASEVLKNMLNSSNIQDQKLAIELIKTDVKQLYKENG